MRTRKIRKPTNISLYPKGMNPYQNDFHAHFANGKRFVLFLGGIRGGKTFSGARQALVEMVKKKKGLGWIVAPTYQMSKPAERDFLELLEGLPYKYNKTEREIRLGWWVVQIKTADDPDHLRGPKVNWIWIDEGSQISKHCFDILMGRVMDMRGNIWITTTPKGRNWLYEDFYLKCEPSSDIYDSDYAFVKGTTRDNKFLPPEEVEKLANRYESEFAQQEIEAEFTAFRGLVYKCFDRLTHVTQKRIPPSKSHFFESFLAGVDFGVHDPCCYLLLGRFEGRYYVLDEIYESGLSIEDFGDKIREVEARWGISPPPRYAPTWGDGAAWRTSLQAYGIATIPVEKKNVTKGVQQVQYMLKQKMIDDRPQLMVSPTCANTIREFGLYRFRTEKQTDEVAPGDKFVDADNHAMDALRYALNAESMALPQMRKYSQRRMPRRVPIYHPADAVTGY